MLVDLATFFVGDVLYAVLIGIKDIYHHARLNCVFELKIRIKGRIDE